MHDQDTDDAAPWSDTMTADHSWSFVVATGTAPPYPSSVHLTMGNPTGAIADIGQPNNYLMEKPEFALAYDRELGGPKWVSWHLSSEWFGTLTRNDTFRADPAVPAAWYRVQSFDYSGSGFDRGTGSRTPTATGKHHPDQPGDVLMSNIIAQSPDNNQGRGRCWGLPQGSGRRRHEIYIVAGGRQGGRGAMAACR